MKGAAGASIYGSRAENGVISIKTKRATDGARGLRIDARQETGVDDIQGSYPFPTRHFMLMNEDGHALLREEHGVPDVLAHDRLGHRSAAHQRRRRRRTCSTRIRSSATTASAPRRASRSSRVCSMTNQWPKCYNPVDCIKTNNPHLSSTITLTGKQGNTGYYTSFNSFIQQGAVKYLQGLRPPDGARQRRPADRLRPHDVDADDVHAQPAERTEQLRPGSASRVNTRRRILTRHRQSRAASSIARTSRPRRARRTTNNNPLYFDSVLLRPHRREPIPRLAHDALERDRVAVVRVARPASTSERARASRCVDKGYPRAPAGRRRRAIGTHVGRREQRSRRTTSLLDGDGDAQLRPGPHVASRRPLHVRGSGSRTASARRGSTLTLGGLLDLDQRDDVAHARLRAVLAARARRLGRPQPRATRIATSSTARFARTAARCSAQTSATTTTIVARWPGCMSDEPWFARLANIFDQFKFRAAVGTAGGRPSFSAQYEALTHRHRRLDHREHARQQGSPSGERRWRPSTASTLELFHKYGVQLTYARDITTDEILPVPPSVSSGFSNQWKNAGTMDGRTWEASLNVPIITKRSLVWTSRLNWDQTRSYITRIDVPEYLRSNTDAHPLRGGRAVRQRLRQAVRARAARSCRAISSRVAARARIGSRTTRATSSGSAPATRTRTASRRTCGSR